jgi:hypothetical protein
VAHDPLEPGDHVRESARALVVEDLHRVQARPGRDADHALAVVPGGDRPRDVRAVAVAVIGALDAVDARDRLHDREVGVGAVDPGVDHGDADLRERGTRGRTARGERESDPPESVGNLFRGTRGGVLPRGRERSLGPSLLGRALPGPGLHDQVGLGREHERVQRERLHHGRPRTSERDAADRVAEDPADDALVALGEGHGGLVRVDA